MLGWTGGYGNYTCIQHTGALSTCYGHQSRSASRSGAARHAGPGDRLRRAAPATASAPTCTSRRASTGRRSTRWATSRAALGAPALGSGRVQPEIDIGPLDAADLRHLLRARLPRRRRPGRAAAQEIGKPPDWAYEMIFAALVGGLVGSRLDYLIQNWADVSDDLLGTSSPAPGSSGSAAWSAARSACPLGLVARLPGAAAARPVRARRWRSATRSAASAASSRATATTASASDLPWAMAYPDGTVPTHRRGAPDADLRDARHGPRRARAVAPARPRSGPACCSRSTSCSPASSGSWSSSSAATTTVVVGLTRRS